VKLFQALPIIALIAIVSSASLVSALEQNEASVTTFMSANPKVPGEKTSIRVLFTSNTNKNLSIYYVGIHIDWMNTDQLYGIDYSQNPKIVPAMKKNVILDFINYTVPTTASIGAHTYYIGVDGYDEAGQPFSWKSNDEKLYVINPSNTTDPTSTPTTPNQNPQGLDQNILLYIALIAAVAVIIILLAVVIKMKKQVSTTANTNVNQP